MAHYMVTCEECGKKYEVQLFGKMENREWHLEHDTHICVDCTAKLRAKRNEEAAKANAEAGLPPLEGTPKQVAWAESIRVKMLEELTTDNVIAWVTSRKGSTDIILAYVKRIGRTISLNDLTPSIEAAKSEKSALWYINHRDEHYAMALKAAESFLEACKGGQND